MEKEGKKLTRQELVEKRREFRKNKEAVFDERFKGLVGVMGTEEGISHVPVDMEETVRSVEKEKELSKVMEESGEKYKAAKAKYRTDHTFGQRVRNLVNDILPKGSEKDDK